MTSVGEKGPGSPQFEPGSPQAARTKEGGSEGLDNDIPPAPNMVVVDRTGVHSLRIEFCRCLNHPSDVDQLLDMGLYPASQQRVKTCFTFDVLDDFLLDNLECKTSALNFYSRLRRVTDPVLPDRVPVRSKGVPHMPQLTGITEPIHGASPGIPTVVPFDGSQEAGVRLSRTIRSR